LPPSIFQFLRVRRPLIPRSYFIKRLSSPHAQKNSARKLELRRIIGGRRLYDYCLNGDHMNPDEYAKKVFNGELVDPVLTFQLKNNFKCVKILSNYLLDSSSLNYLTFIEWKP
jgi:hypothetical protein